MLFHHGWPSSATQAAVIEDQASRLGLQLVAVDRPGVADTSPLPGSILADFSSDLSALREHLGWKNFYVFGVSGGGPYALLTAARLSGVVACGVCCGAPLPEMIRRPGSILWIYRFLIFLVDRFPTFARITFAILRLGVRNLPGPLLSGLLRHFLPRPDALALKPLAIRRLVFAPVRRAFGQSTVHLLHDATRYLHPWGFDPTAITTPTLFWHGENDLNLPPALTRELAQSIPNASFTIFPNQGHYSLPLNLISQLLEELISILPLQSDSPTKDRITSASTPELLK